LYRVPEPNPYQDRVATVEASQHVYYQEQKDFPPAQNNFDCEAVFYWDRGFCFLTKHRADFNTTLYLLAESEMGRGAKPQPLHRIALYNLESSVTAADQYKGRIAVLTYKAV